MTPDPNIPAAVPPPPPGFGSDLFDPWPTTAADVVAAAAENCCARRQVLIPTGRDDLDHLAPGTLSVVLAAHGSAATEALVAIAHHAAYHHDLTTLLYPLRSTLSQIGDHLARAHNSAELTADTAAATVDDLRDCPLYIIIGSPVTVTRIHFDAVDPDSAAPHLIVVDAIDLLLSTGATRDLKHLALELNAAIVCSSTVHASGTVTAADVPAAIAAAADTILLLQPTL